MSLGSTLLIMSIIATLIFTLASSSIAHLRLSFHRSQAQVADNASRSVVAVALARILENTDYGTSGESLALTEEGEGTLSFAAEANPRSYNNIEGEGSIAGWDGRVVPPQSIHLVGQSKLGNAVRTTEALYAIPPYPYAISSAQPVQSVGSLVVGGVESLDAAYESMAKEDLLPADLASNANAADAVELGSGAYVAGDVTAVGGVTATEAEVRGQVTPGSERVALPEISLDRYDPQGQSGVLPLHDGSIRSIEGLARHSGDLDLNGPLELDNGLLYVDGDFTIRLNHLGEGGLRGYGALIVRGKTTIEGASKFAHLNGVALLSEGDVEIIGIDMDSSFFQGLMYSEGDVRAENITVLGGLVANSSEEDSEVFLRDSRAIHVPELTQIDVGNPPTWTFNIIKDTSDTNTNPGSGPNDPNPPLEIGVKSMSADFRVYYDDDAEKIRLVGVGKATIEANAAVLSEEPQGQSSSERMDPAEVDARFGGLSPGIFDVPTTPGHLLRQEAIVPIINQGSTLLNMEGTIIDFDIDLETLRNDPNALVGLEITSPTVREESSTPGANGGGHYNLYEYDIVGTTIALESADARALRDRILEIINPGRPTTVYNFDPNQFLALADKIRLQYMRTE